MKNKILLLIIIGALIAVTKFYIDAIQNIKTMVEYEGANYSVNMNNYKEPKDFFFMKKKEKAKEIHRRRYENQKRIKSSNVPPFASIYNRDNSMPEFASNKDMPAGNVSNDRLYNMPLIKNPTRSEEFSSSYGGLNEVVLISQQRVQRNNQMSSSANDAYYTYSVNNTNAMSRPMFSNNGTTDAVDVIIDPGSDPDPTTQIPINGGMSVLILLSAGYTVLIFIKKCLISKL